VRVEKQIEVRRTSGSASKGRSQSERRDWPKFIKSLAELPARLKDAAGLLGNKELYFWIEFHRRAARNIRKEDNKYYLIRSGRAYERGGAKEIPWKEVCDFIRASRPDLWCDVSVVRAFSITEAAPALADSNIWAVFEALKPIRDMWRSGK
jgi:hypothetical protein